MAFQRVKKMLGISAVVICCGTVMFTFNGCEKKEEPVAVEQAIIVEDTTEEKPLGGAIANDIDLTQTAPEVEKEEEIEVFYAQCGTEADKLTVKNGEPVDYKIKDYAPVVYLKYMQDLDYDYTYDNDEGAVYIEDRLVSNNVEKTEDGKLLVKDYQMQNGKPILKYVKTAPTEVEARYVGTASLDSPIQSGITFVLEENDEGVYKLVGMRGVFDEDLTDAKLPLYEGTFIGWSLYQDEPPCFNVDDEVKISSGMTLLPYFEDNDAGKKATETGECVADSPEEIEGKAVLRVVKTDDGTYALADFNVETDTVKTADGQTVDKEVVAKQQSRAKTTASTNESKDSKKDESKSDSKDNKKDEAKQTTEQQPSQPQPQQQPVTETPTYEDDSSYVTDAGVPAWVLEEGLQTGDVACDSYEGCDMSYIEIN